jgi:DNA-binding NtrC family response regulator
VLITDIVMPSGVNGIALARMARMRNLAIRTIYITGYDVPGVQQEATGPLMRKPLADDELLAIVAAQLAEQANPTVQSKGDL